eukprot:GHUV01052840.1.p1 GENE.GHUV01052840.1~~GHUV01052840.1.p1  ORF type:complete len:109 (+),score=14.50 GHUV01052840.1:807-1133(+)
MPQTPLRTRGELLHEFALLLHVLALLLALLLQLARASHANRVSPVRRIHTVKPTRRDNHFRQRHRETAGARWLGYFYSKAVDGKLSQGKASVLESRVQGSRSNRLMVH